MGAPAKERTFRTRSITVDVDVDIDEQMLEENGYHHEDDCDAELEADIAEDRQALSDWHDQTHGLSLWASCTHEPCKLLTDEFRSSR